MSEIKQMLNQNLQVNSLSLFTDNTNLAYFYKKTEKLVSALYMLTSFITDREPVKWQLREEGVRLLAQSLTLSDRSSSELVLAYVGFISTGLKIVSLLQVAHLGGIVSKMNFDILKYEFETLTKMVETQERGINTKGVVFPDQFFTVENHTGQIPPVESKGQSVLSDRLSVKSSQSTVKPTEQKQKDKSNRQDIILSLLRKGGDLGIKDFTTLIKDCSEKTIQRELVSLVSKGQVTKEGEKRWSRYSLK